MAYPRNARAAITRIAGLSIAFFIGTTARQLFDHHDIRAALTEGAILMMVTFLVLTPIFLLIVRARESRHSTQARLEDRDQSVMM
ncbi:MAG: hypothetical protein JWQ95_1545 [Sphaerisporangium sp.]|nr:hypothetical protein [Sphaerisporangium sp.]